MRDQRLVGRQFQPKLVLEELGKLLLDVFSLVTTRATPFASPTSSTRLEPIWVPLTIAARRSRLTDLTR
jgi:hypothetical protein